MGTVSDSLDLVQDRLHDDGAIWPRAELLNWFNDGYRQLLARAQAVVRIRPLDIPGRHTYGVTFQWEDRHTKGGTFWLPRFTAFGGHRQVSTLWEVEHLDQIGSPSESRKGITHQWEWAHAGDNDGHFRFGLPKNHERIKRLEYDHKRLVAASVREFDEVDDAWMRRQGEPTWWTVGVGRVRSVEVYEIETEYQQAYALQNFEHGLPREMSGSRTYEVALPEGRIFNNFAYTTKGDSDAINIKGMSFAPASAYTNTWEKTNSHTTDPAYNFTINLTMNLPGMEYVVIHPWEYAEVSGPTLASDAANTKRGMFAWERHSAEGEWSPDHVVPTADERPDLAGLGWRFTKEADTRSDGFAVQGWEKQHLDGDTITADSFPKGTFVWEVFHGTDEVIFGLGTVRSAVSTDRQYVPMASDPTPQALLGGVRDWRGSEDNIVAWEVIVPDLALTEDDTPALIPAPLQKYVRFYTLAQAFGHEGEGHNKHLARHYDSRFTRGVALFTRLADVAHKDRVFVREDAGPSRGRPPLVRLPSTFERVL